MIFMLSLYSPAEYPEERFYLTDFSITWPEEASLTLCMALVWNPNVLTEANMIALAVDTQPMAFNYPDTGALEPDFLDFFSSVSGMHSAQMDPHEGSTSLWVADEGSCQIIQFSIPEGDLAGNPIEEVSRVGSGACSNSTDPLAFDLPTDVAPDLLGNLYIADGEGANHRVVAVDSDFNVLWVQGAADWVAGDGPGEFNFPHSIAYDSVNNYVWVADRNNARVQALDAETGEYVLRVDSECGDEILGPTSVRVSDTELFVLNTGLDQESDMGYFRVYTLAEVVGYQGTESCNAVEVHEIAEGSYPHQLSLDLDNDIVYVTTFYGVPDYVLQFKAD